MTLHWTTKSLADLTRLHEFLASRDRRAAARAIQSLTEAAARLLEHPRIGERLEQYGPREVRRILIGKYEMRYELQPARMIVLRIWHTRESR